mgnify:CR=1 FL=1
MSATVVQGVPVEAVPVEAVPVGTPVDDAVATAARPSIDGQALLARELANVSLSDAYSLIGHTAQSLQSATELDLSRQGLRDDALPKLAAALAATRPPRLARIDLSGNKFGDAAVAALVRSLACVPALAALAIDGTFVHGGGFTQELGAATSAALAGVLPQLCLQSLSLAHNGGFTGEQAAEIAEAVGKSPTLAQVDLYGSDIGEEAAAALVASLRGRAGMDAVGGRAREEMNLSAGAASAADVVLLAASVQSAGCRLEKLDLSSNALSDAALGELARAISAVPGGGAQLLTLNLGRCGLVELGAFCAGVGAGSWDTLKTLLLPGNRLGDAACVALAGVLPKLPMLTLLRLNENDVGDGGAAALGGALAAGSAPALGELVLSRNRIGDAGLQALADGIAGMPLRAGSGSGSSSASLSLLHLGGNAFKEGGLFSKNAAWKAMKAACKAKKVRVQDLPM